MTPLNVTDPPLVVWHIAGMGHWKEVVPEQIALLQESGLRSDIYITYLGEEEGYLKALLDAAELSYDIVDSDPNLAHCETLAMLQVERLAKKKNVNRPILYMHTKGVSNPGDWCKQRWRHLMQEHVVRQWRLNLLHLRDHDAVGVNWIEGGSQHFSGTFWIAHPNWIRRLPPFAEYHAARGMDRYSCEMWIGAAQWCKAKSLACRNEAFWESWYDFDRLLPSAVPGSFDYRGTRMQQVLSVTSILPQLFKKHKPARVLEIGTGDGGFIRMVRDALNDLDMKHVPTMSVDVEHRDGHNLAKKEGSTLLTLNPFDATYEELYDDVVKFVRGEGLTLAFCDGISPPREFAALAKYVKVKDVVLSHDYAPDRGYFDRHLYGKVWNWLETTDADLEPTVRMYGMERWEKDTLQDIVWCGYRKGKEPDILHRDPSTVPVVPVALVITTIPERVALLSRALKSVASQTVRPKEIHICVDNGRDGAAVNRNYGLGQSGCDYVAFLDDDDELFPDHLEKLYRTAVEHKADLVYPSHEVFRDNKPDPPKGPWMRQGLPFDADALREANFIPVTVLCNRKLAVEAGGFQNAPGTKYEDWGLWLKMLDAGAKFVHLPLKTWRWNFHTKQTAGLGV